MPLWKRFWILFTVMWLIVAALHVGSILAFSEGVLERQKAIWTLALAILVPAAAYLFLWGWSKWRAKNKSGSEPD
jgi:type VI protein secretion system component VasK